jgi:hypothetical protein
VGLVYDLRGLPGVTAARPGVAGVLQGIMEHKRKMQHTGAHRSNTRFRVGSSS